MFETARRTHPAYTHRTPAPRGSIVHEWNSTIPTHPLAPLRVALLPRLRLLRCVTSRDPPRRRAHDPADPHANEQARIEISHRSPIGLKNRLSESGTGRCLGFLRVPLVFCSHRSINTPSSARLANWLPIRVLFARCLVGCFIAQSFPLPFQIICTSDARGRAEFIAENKRHSPACRTLTGLAGHGERFVREVIQVYVLAHAFLTLLRTILFLPGQSRHCSLCSVLAAT